MSIAKMMKSEFSDKDYSLSGIGGVETGGDAAEFILLGANTVQVESWKSFSKAFFLWLIPLIVFSCLWTNKYPLNDCSLHVNLNSVVTIFHGSMWNVYSHTVLFVIYHIMLNSGFMIGELLWCHNPPPPPLPLLRQSWYIQRLHVNLLFV